MTQTTKVSAINLLIEKISTTLAGWSTKRFLLTIAAIQIILHIPIISLPPMGQHTWRQVVWTAEARNYYEEKDSFFYPSQDVRIAADDKGALYFEFPLLPYLIGISYQITGFSHANSRLMMLLMGIVLIFSSHKFMRSFGASESRARWFTFFISFSPYFFYYSITASPNMPALTWFILGIALINPQLEQQSWNYKFWLGILLISLGTLSKATYLFFGLSVAYLFFYQFYKDRNYITLVVAFVSLLIVLIPNALIYLHSNNLAELAPYERQKGVTLSARHFMQSWQDFIATLKPAVIQWFLEMYVNTMAIPFFLIGSYFALKNKKWRSKQGQFWVMWLISFLIFSLFFFSRFRQHAYYMTPILVFAAMGSTYGIEISLRSGKARLFICILLFCIPFVMVGRVGHRWLWAKQVPNELLYQSEEIQQAIPEDARIMVFGDNTPIVYLYYLHRKGLSLSPSVEKEKLKEYYEQGIRYVVSEIPISMISGLRDFSMVKITQIGNFAVYRLDKQ
ncbi:glycosyltransferase family 39 protein [bacterium]|nr:glycosyltransferase family 39 protein [bacterium]